MGSGGHGVLACLCLAGDKLWADRIWGGEVKGGGLNVAVHVLIRAVA